MIYNSVLCTFSSLFFFFLQCDFFFLFSHTDYIDYANVPQDNLFLIMLMRLSSPIPRGDTSLRGEASSTLILFSSPILWSTSETSNSSTCRCAVQPRVRSVTTTPDTSHPIKVRSLSFSLCVCVHSFVCMSDILWKYQLIANCVVDRLVPQKWTSPCTFLGVGG